MESPDINAIHRRKQYIAIILRRAKPGGGSSEDFLKGRTLKYSIIKIEKIIRKTPFLIVGGFATRLYMPERMTLDLGVLVPIEDAVKVEDELIRGGCKKQGNLTIGGSTWTLPDNTNLDVIILDEPWIKEAIQQPRIGSDGLPYIELPYLVLMKLHSSRVQDIADISRMLGDADEERLQNTRNTIRSYRPEDVEDLESLIQLGQLEMAE